MKESLKKILRPIISTIAALSERIKGFHTDSDSYLPNRVEMILGIYEQSTVDALLSNLPPDGVFVDIGANVGYLSRAMLRDSSPSRVYAIEANPKLIPFLHQNLRRFSNVEIFPVALSDSEGKTTFYVGKDSNVSSITEGYTARHHNHSVKWTSEIRAIEVDKTTGDLLFGHLPKIDLVKIDIEGHELNALQGMEQLFSSQKIRCILFEYNPFAQRCAKRDPESLIHFFLQRNFQCFALEGDFQRMPITDRNIKTLTEQLGDKGYISVLAKIKGTSNK